MKWYLKVVRDNYANFSGRARRKEYWMFILFSQIFGILISIYITFILWLAIKIFGTPEFRIMLFNFVIMLNAIYTLAMIIPGLAVLVRRLHDIGKSGIWIFIILIPFFIGGIWLLILLCTEGERGYNKYGADPKLVENNNNIYTN